MSLTPPILFQDARLVVLDKPAGLPVHAGPRGGPSIEDCFPQLSRRRDGPWLAHRLDADTAGCLVVALRRAALHQAQALFAAGQVRKTYWAVVQGRPAEDEGVMETALQKRTGPAGWRMVSGADGQPAQTVWRLRGTGGGLSWLELHPRTGRTHQVRVHCAALGCPVLGDPIYGTTGPDTAVPLHLLARAIYLPLDPPVQAVAFPPPHMLAALRGCRWDGTSVD